MYYVYDVQLAICRPDDTWQPAEAKGVAVASHDMDRDDDSPFDDEIAGEAERHWLDEHPGDKPTAVGMISYAQVDQREDEEAEDAAESDEPTGYCGEHGEYDPAGDCPGCVAEAGDGPA